MNASVAAAANVSAASGGVVRSSGSAAVLPQDLGATMLQWMFDWTQGVVDVAICSNCPEVSAARASASAWVCWFKQ